MKGLRLEEEADPSSSGVAALDSELEEQSNTYNKTTVSSHANHGLNEQSCAINRRLMNGLLDILLTKQFPKSKEFNPKSPDKVFCRLN